jgi:demethylmenaquinone methyltransferase/2-methoxy-6-polyprenyl-1,4-benzoquinol methylase
MSSYVFMKVLESAAHRYDRGIRLLSGGRIDIVYDAIAELVARPGRWVLDVGCGTGAVALACAARGASVVGIDLNAEMLEVARAKTLPTISGGKVEWQQLGAAEIEDRFPSESFDAVVACLVLSEMSRDEQSYTLRAARRCLRPGGDLVIADEVLPPAGWRRLRYRVGRLPLAAITYLLTQTTTSAMENLPSLVSEAGFIDVDEKPFDRVSLAMVHAHRPPEAA